MHPMRARCYSFALLLLLTVPPQFVFAAGPDEMGPGFSLPVLGTDGALDLSDLRGRIVYLDFWASWCGPCRESLPLYEELQQQFDGGDFQLLAINLDEFRDDAEAFLDKHPVSYPVLLDPAGATARAWRIKAMPSSFLLDRQGRIIKAYAGFTPAHMEEIRNDIQAQLD